MFAPYFRTNTANPGFLPSHLHQKSIVIGGEDDLDVLPGGLLTGE